MNAVCLGIENNKVKDADLPGGAYDQDILLQILQTFEAGLKRPIPFFPNTSYAWHEARYQEGASLNEARNRARRTWRPSSNAVRPESDDDYYKIFFDNPDFDSKEFHELAELIYGRIYPSEK